MPSTELSKGIHEGYSEAEDGWGDEQNENLRRLNAYAWDQWANDPETSTGLTYGFRGGIAWAEATDVYTLVAAGTVALTASATNYVERTAAGVVTVNQVGFSKGQIPMARVTTNATDITAIEDWRPALGPRRRARQVVDGWFQDNVPASQAATQLTRLAAGASPNVWIAQRPGSVTGVAVKSNEARTAGTLTVEVYINGGATGLTAVLDGTNTTFKFTSANPGTHTFVAGDEIDLRSITDASWAPTTADIRGTLEVET